MFDIKVSNSQTLDVQLDITPAQNLFQQALEKIGSYKDTNYQDGKVIIKGKSRYGLQGVPLIIQLDKTSDTTTKVIIGGKSDDVGGVGAKKCIERLISTFNTLNSSDTEQIAALESTPSFERKTGFTKKKLFFLVAGFVVLLVFIMNSKGSQDSSDSNPAGKSYFGANTQNYTTVEYTFGSDEGEDFLGFSTLNYDSYGGANKVGYRTGTYSFQGQTISCKFNDGLPPYKLNFEKVDGEWSVVDGHGTVCVLDDPTNRK